MKKKILIPQFKTVAEAQKFVKDNMHALIAEKKSVMKTADPFNFSVPIYNSITKQFTTKAEEIDAANLLSKDEIDVKLAINTTNLLDSHGDVHIPGLWKKSLKENGKRLMLLKQHSWDFDDVIAEGLEGEVVGKTEMMTWKDLGFSWKGETEVLVFEAKIKKSNNEEMFNRYAKKRVKNHSVGMHYVNLFLCINSEEKYYREEKENWEKYYEEIINQDVADERGWFWAVTEAKALEGSAVVRGSNYATPVLEVKGEPAADHSQETDKEPAETTLKTFDYLAKNFKLN